MEQKREEVKVVIYRNGEKVKEETINSLFLVTDTSNTIFAQCKPLDFLNLLTNVSALLDEAIEETSKKLKVSMIEIVSAIEKSKRFNA